MPVALTLLAASALAAGWRNDGTARYPDAHPPSSFAADAFAVRTVLPGPGNSSPVRLGDLVCGTSEPTRVWCADGTTGILRWEARNNRVDALPEAERVAKQIAIDFTSVFMARRDALREELAKLHREARRADATEARARQAAANAELAAIDAKLAQDSVAGWLTPPDGTMIGYTSPTPIEHDGALYVLTGNGVVSQRLPLVDDLEAALEGHADVDGHVIAWGQPTLAGDRLVVAFEKGLVAVLDVRDGTARLESVSALPEATRSTPLFEDGTAWVRTLSTLWRFDAPSG
jgi:hypothetical protein